MNLLEALPEQDMPKPQRRRHPWRLGVIRRAAETVREEMGEEETAELEIG